jgi:hypothetical protein
VALPSDFEVVRTDADRNTRAWHVVLPMPPDQIDQWVATLIGADTHWSASVARDASPPSIIRFAQLGLVPRNLLDYVKTGPDAPALATLFQQAAGGDTATFSPELAAALRVADAISRLLRTAIAIEDADVGVARDPLPDLVQKSRQKEWLHDMARVRPCIDALDNLDFIARANSVNLNLRFIASDPRLNILSIGDLPTSGPVQGLLLDAWNDTTPGTETLTGIALHYDAPARALPKPCC